MKQLILLLCVVLVFLTFLIEPNVRYTSIEGQRFLPLIEIPSTSTFKVQNSQDRLLNPGEWCNLTTGIVLSIPKGYHGHLYPIESLTRDGIILLPTCILTGENRTITPFMINTRSNDYMIASNRTIAFIVFVKHLVQDTLEDIKI